MTVYVIAQLKFKDRPVYDRYQAAFGRVFKAFGGTILAADTRPAVLEGARECDKIVLLSFPDEDAYRTWADSPGYRDISRDRRAGADCTVLLVKGIEA